MSRTILLISLIALTLDLSFARQKVANEMPPSVALPAPLARVLTDYEEAWKNHDANGLANLFAENGFVLQANRQPVRGRAAIRRAYQQAGGPLALRAIAFAAEGQIGYIIGCYARAKGERDEGKFTLTLIMGTDKRWMIMSDMDNSNMSRR